MKASEQINDDASIPSAGATEAMQVDDIDVTNDPSYESGLFFGTNAALHAFARKLDRQKFFLSKNVSILLHPLYYPDLGPNKYRRDAAIDNSERRARLSPAAAARRAGAAGAQPSYLPVESSPMDTHKQTRARALAPRTCRRLNRCQNTFNLYRVRTSGARATHTGAGVRLAVVPPLPATPVCRVPHPAPLPRPALGASGTG
ncbi:hypothetical protein EVAR_21360_1 [Eumeta japonica]|uniref:Uncharacterized protein n=1 Tax=Eumeta variegata TaxID=151549 RepID=A0A4C1YEI5_EUMVA|nr:hypothetical protein EVAR_21360_1 [Eumeta japonica]